LNILDSITAYFDKNPPRINSLGEIIFEPIPNEISSHLQFFHTTLEGVIFNSGSEELNSNNILLLGENRMGYWTDDQWLPFLSFYLDQKLGENHFLRNRLWGQYWPIQQIFEEYIESVKGGFLDDFNEAHGERYNKSHLGQIIEQYLRSNDINIFERTFYAMLFRRVFNEESISDGYYSIGKLNESTSSKEKTTVVYFRNEDKIIFDNVNRSTVQSFLNEVYLNISDQVQSHSYGKEWLLFNVTTNELVAESEIINRVLLLDHSPFVQGVFVVLIKKISPN
jgi:hypothetical protein